MEMAAIYRCTDCLEERKFGDCADDPVSRPLLSCGICKRATRHQFVGIDSIGVPEEAPAAAEVTQ